MTWLDDARRHMTSCYPQEGCGLVVETSDGLEFIACQNRAQTASEHFVIAGPDYADAEDRGPVRLVVHSHPDCSARPSEGDLVMCEASQVLASEPIEWLIIRVDGREVNDVPVSTPTCSEEYRFGPSGYLAPLVGRSFSFGILDCFSLIQDYYARELNIKLPNFPREDNFWKGPDAHEIYLENFHKAGFSPIVGPIRKHDVILMQVRAQVVNHGGVFIGDVPNMGKGLMLHHVYDRLSERVIYGGYWLEHTRLVVRHESLRDLS